jgi:3'-phosphoadenosine 5'-phosphosulfate sulfotransferase (PAPS reductase)/FAD synthetase
MADPFFITGPAVISFSGGRTSGYMLWRILQAHNGKLPDDVVVCFDNTGREMPATLRFVHECQTRWKADVRWLEYRGGAGLPHSFEEVGYNSASRNGEPFDQIIASRGFLPNPRQIFCSGEMKVRTTRRFIRATYGWTHWKQIVGLRADEGRRVARALARADRDAEYKGITFPMFEARILKADVNEFWADQDFDLELKGAWEGNCDGCLRKRPAALARMFRDNPIEMKWWTDKEAEMEGKTRKASGAVFRLDINGGYAGLRKLEFSQGRLFVDDDGMDAQFEACDAGCGI